MSPVLRVMQPDDLPAVLEVQRQAHRPGLHESAATLDSRRRLAPGFCWVAEQAGRIGGYLFAHPWAGMPPALDRPLAELPARPEHLLLHDLALSPAARGQGLAQALCARIAQAAGEAGLATLRLVALADAVAYWSRLGFTPLALPAEKLAAYGPGARWMQRAL